MDAYVTEEQQLEDIKKWFKKHGKTLVWAMSIVALIVAAFFYWQHHREVLHQQASDQYMALLDGIEQEDKTSIQNASALLLKQYATSPYATLAAFTLASLAIEDNELVTAQEHLEWIIKNSQQTPFQALARVRLMRVLLSANKPEEALKVYDERKADGFLTIMAELKGDALVKQNKIDEAQEAYKKAYQSAPEQGMYGALLKMKMENLGIDLEQLSDEKAEEEKVKP